MVAEIDKRAAPGPDSFAFSGFVAKGQSFLECLMQDWRTYAFYMFHKLFRRLTGQGRSVFCSVRSLNLTHIDLAKGLRKLLCLKEEVIRKLVNLELDRAELLPALKLSSEKQTFCIYGKQTRGFQPSLFMNDDDPETEESRTEFDVEYVYAHPRSFVVH
jgi:hypothetical protein